MWKMVQTRPGIKPSDPSHYWYQFLAAQTVKIASINGLGELDKLENELEDEIQRENAAPPREIIGRIRRKGEDILHSKPVLLMVVILNVIDCLLVLGELTVDFYYMSHLLKIDEDVTSTFMENMENFYPRDLAGITNSKIETLYSKILQSTIHWNESDVSLGSICNVTSFVFNQSFAQNLTPSVLNQTFVWPGKSSGSIRESNAVQMAKEYHIVEEIGHALHFTSVSILAVLVFETSLKILATVPRFFKSKLQVFDAVVILISFVVDLIFIKGLMGMEIDKFVVVLTFLLPWRIIRVLNSLVVAVIDKERFALKILYKQKKKVDRNYSEASHKIHLLEKQLEAIKGLCSSKGIEAWEVKKALGSKQNKSSTLNTLGKLAFQTLAPMQAKKNMRFDYLRRHSNSTPNLPMVKETFANTEDCVSRL